MGPERWQLVVEVFQAVMDRDPTPRAAFLASVCDDDPLLLREVESLIASYERGESTQVTIADEYDAPSLTGRSIGSYRIIREIGRGGMGAVYLASRADQAFEKLVAIKLIQRGLDTTDVVRRFRSERQILAALDHPNITRLLDGGTTDDGLPYFVMEYIEGEPVDKYCDAHKLNITDRLQLFRAVCAAVHYAHQHLVIHRDIKAGNILVTAEGIPRLLDFGIAKLLAEGPGISDHTLTGTRAMTPDCASPEQVRGEPITTASDVYSLGVLLYRLLTGHRPYRLDGRLPSEIEKAICEENPEVPSQVIYHEEVGPHGQLTPGSVSETREGTPEKLRRRLRGDLDNIVLMALRKEPARRYASVQQFSEDMRRHLQGLTVIARRDTARYRTGKFITRHKAGVGAAALVALALIGGVIATTWQARVARAERARAEREFNDVRTLTTSFLFEFHEAIRDLPGATPARKLLVQRALNYLSKLAGQARGNRRLQLELAEAYLKVGDVQGNAYEANLGDPAGAAKSYGRALEISESLTRTDPRNPDALRYEARSYKSLGEVLPVLGNPSDAVTDLRRAAGILESLIVAGSNDKQLRQDLASCYQSLGDVQGHPGLQNLGDPVAALESYRKSLALYQALAESDPKYNPARRGMALVQIRMGDLKEARDDLQGVLQAYLSALQIMESLSAAEPTNAQDQRRLAHAYRKVGGIQEDLRNFKEALGYYDKATDINRSLMNADPNNHQASMAFAISLRWSGDLLYRMGQHAAALTRYRKVLEVLDRMAATDPQNVVVRGRQSEMLVYTADLVLQTGNIKEARRLTSRGLAITRDLAGRADATPDDLSQYAMNFLTCQPADLREPQTALRYAKMSQAKAVGTDSDRLNILGQAYFATGDVVSAIESEEKALRLLAPPPSNQIDSPTRRRIKTQLAKFKSSLRHK
jgi:serine/threonine protein kinase/tetratricopeptide (TPR) repeat protein